MDLQIGCLDGLQRPEVPLMSQQSLFMLVQAIIALLMNIFTLVLAMSTLIMLHKLHSSLYFLLSCV
jgi:hypothetical protein